MEYALYAVYYIFQSVFNMLLDLVVVDGVSVGSLLIGCMVVSFILSRFKFGHYGFKFSRGKDNAKESGKGD